MLYAEPAGSNSFASGQEGMLDAWREIEPLADIGAFPPCDPEVLDLFRDSLAGFNLDPLGGTDFWKMYGTGSRY